MASGPPPDLLRVYPLRMAPTTTHTRTHTVTVPANPHLACAACGARVEWWPDTPGPVVNMPCGHTGEFDSVCMSWGPVSGCTCMAQLGAEHVCPVPPSAGLLAIGSGR